MEWIDAAIIVIIAISAVIGFAKGFIREFIFIAALIAGGILAFDFAAMPARWVPFREWGMGGQMITTHDLSYIISFILIILGAVLLGQLIAMTLTSFYEGKNPGRSLFGWNRMLGLLFGAVRGLLIVVVLTALLSLTKFTESESWEEAEMLPFFEDIAVQLIEQFPSEYSQHFNLNGGRSHMRNE